MGSESDLIKGKDLIQEGFLDASKKEVQEFIQILDAAKVSLQSVHKESVSNLKKIGGATDAKSLKETNAELKKAAEARKALEKVEKDLAAGRAIAAKALAKQRADDAKAADKAKKQTDEYIKSETVRAAQEKARIARLKAIAIEESNLVGLEQKLLATNARLRIERAQLTGQEADYAVKLKEINDQLDKNNAIIKESSDKQKQQSLNVGNYTESIVLAIDKTGLYSKAIGKITAFVETYEGIIKAATASTAANSAATETNAATHEANAAALKVEEAATQKLSLARRALNAITSPVGLLILAAAALAAIAKAVFDVNQKLQDTLDIGKAFAEDKFWGTGNQFYNLTIATINLRKEIGGLELNLQALIDISGDLTEISNDESIALGRRQKAAEDAAQARVVAAKQELEITTRQKAIADLALKAEESRSGVGTGNARQEFYDKQIEASKKLFEATDKLDDLERTNAQDLRIRTQNRIIDEIELIRSKKLGADSAVETLKKQVDDETTILKNRRDAFVKLESEQLKAQNEEIRLLEKFGLTRKEIDDLIETRDAVALARKLKALDVDRLSVGQQTELAKVITETQKNELDRNAQKQKIQEKEIENQKTILKLTQEINQAELDQQAAGAQENLAEAQGRTSVLEQRSLARSFLFSQKTRNATLGSLKEEEQRNSELNEAQNKALEQRTKDKIDAIKKEIEEESKEREIGEKEIIQIQQQAQFDREKQLEDAISRETALEAKKANYIKSIQKAQTIEALQQIQNVTAALEQELDKRNQLQQQAFDEQINQQQENVETQQRLAEKGLDNTLAFERARLDKDQLAKKEAAEKAAREQELLDLTQQFNGFLQARLKQNPAPSSTSAISGALADTLIARGIAKGIVQFASDGNNMIEGSGSTTSDSIPFMLSRKEAVVKASENIKHNDAVVDLNAGVFGRNWMPIHQFETSLEAEKRKMEAEIGHRSFMINQNNEVVSLLKDIKNRPVQQIDADRLGNLIETVYKDGRKEVTKHKTRRSLG